MTKSNILFIGMDVHKESIEIAIADDGANGEVRCYGRIGGTLDALKKTLRKLVSEDKTDKRDTVQLVRLFRAGELKPVYVPDREDEAMRDLSRAREDAMIIQKAARQRLKAFLLRHNIRYPGRANWSEKHLRWLADGALGG